MKTEKLNYASQNIYERGYLPPKVIEMAKEIAGGMRNRIKQFEAQTSKKMKIYWAEKVMEIATPEMWLTYYQSLAKAESGAKGGSSKSEAKKPPAALMAN